MYKMCFLLLLLFPLINAGLSNGTEQPKIPAAAEEEPVGHAHDVGFVHGRHLLAPVRLRVLRDGRETMADSAEQPPRRASMPSP